jgi:hypothetical protein
MGKRALRRKQGGEKQKYPRFNAGEANSENPRSTWVVFCKLRTCSPEKS